MIISAGHERNPGCNSTCVSGDREFPERQFCSLLQHLPRGAIPGGRSGHFACRQISETKSFLGQGLSVNAVPSAATAQYICPHAVIHRAGVQGPLYPAMHGHSCTLRHCTLSGPYMRRGPKWALGCDHVCSLRSWCYREIQLSPGYTAVHPVCIP